MTEEAIYAAAARAAGYSFIGTYGYSMGAFAAIAFADHLRANLAIAISPQYSIKDDFDKRWAAQAKSIESWRHQIDARATRNCDIVILYDSKFYLDHAQVNRIKDKVDPGKLRIIEVPFSGHFTLRFLVQGECLPAFWMPF